MAYEISGKIVEKQQIKSAGINNKNPGRLEVFIVNNLPLL